MYSRHEKRTKPWQDVVGTSKRGRSSKALVTRGPPPSCHHPSHFSDEEEGDYELFERHSPNERPDHYAIKYSKKIKQHTINENGEATVYEGGK
jgi:hypothetical protein